ncbi:hypothetical protein IPA_03920 [Ignicoccus pacificus DSM 13166]|uniref:Uncharacterized protein n=1 Tax=Ignicoccus pacificus DSM 13166 TaxID=940294 RepID=A0A977PLI2_9CREN|nr:hypothetical protein IPA_03920 [Ignicoccus pacificus DSM 13166]
MIVEGFLLLYKDFIWMAKGIEHPEGYAVAFPRYHGGKKVSLFPTQFLSLVKTCDCSPSPVPLVPLERAIVYDPRDLIERDTLARDFASVLAKGAGLTGSRVIGVEGDIDLVFYDSYEEVLKALKDLRDDGEIEPEIGKWKSLGEGAIKCKLKHTLLEGKWRGVHYSIRLVSAPRAPSRPVSLGLKAVKGRIIEANNTVMPYEYVLENGVIIESLRMQHSEIPVGAIIEVKGSWEMSSRGERLHLGLNSFMDVISC